MSDTPARRTTRRTPAKAKAAPPKSPTPAKTKDVILVHPKAVAIEAQVAELLTDRDLVLNRGSEAGVAIGMRFKIINPRGTQIKDPTTYEVLGSVELVKVVVKVVSVQEKLSVARTFKTIDVPATGILGASLWSTASAMSALGSPGSKRVETLRSSERFAQEDLDESQSYVKRGDPAIQIVDTAGVDY